MPRIRVVGLTLAFAGFALLAAVMVLTAAQTAPCVPVACSFNGDFPEVPFVARLPLSQFHDTAATERLILVITSVLALLLLGAVRGWLGRLHRLVYGLTLAWGLALVWVGLDHISYAKGPPSWCFEIRAGPPCANWYRLNAVPFHFVPAWP